MRKLYLKPKYRKKMGIKTTSNRRIIKKNVVQKSTVWQRNQVEGSGKANAVSVKRKRKQRVVHQGAWVSGDSGLILSGETSKTTKLKVEGGRTGGKKSIMHGLWGEDFGGRG